MRSSELHPEREREREREKRAIKGPPGEVFNENRNMVVTSAKIANRVKAVYLERKIKGSEGAIDMNRLSLFDFLSTFAFETLDSKKLAFKAKRLGCSICA